MRAGPIVSFRNSVEQPEMPVVDQLQRQRQQRFQPDDAVARRRERQPLRILVPRRMVAGDDVDRAVRETGDDRPPVGLAAQRSGDSFAKVR